MARPLSFIGRVPGRYVPVKCFYSHLYLNFIKHLINLCIIITSIMSYLQCNIVTVKENTCPLI